MRPVKLFMVFLLTLVIVPTQAQDENAAFYIYQNDGHFNGFFYDEVMQISYSKLDTLGYEHDDFVSQEIVTADSTYRIMLSAIDSVGFVQPQVIMNENMREMSPYEWSLLSYLISHDGDTFVFDGSSMEEYMAPRVGDVLVNFSFDDGYSAKITKVRRDNNNYVVTTEPITNLNDVFRQYVSVENITYDSWGHFARRRVAGRPDLNEESFMSACSRSRRTIGDWYGDIFNFQVGGHIPMFGGKLELAPTITSRLNVKAEWNIPLFGTSYIAITPTLHTGVGLEITAGGTFFDKMSSGAGEAGAIPFPATAPLFELVITPDVFVRAECNANIKLGFPQYRGRLWTKLEFIDLWPYVEVGTGQLPGQSEGDGDAGDNDFSLKAEFDGFIQGGLQFPILLKTNKWLSKLLDCEVGTTMYLGPKFSGKLSFDLANALLDNDLYNNLKDSKLTVQLLSADYEMTAKMKSYFGSPKELNLLDGSANILNDMDVYLFPKFGELKKSDYTIRGEGGVELEREKIEITPSRLLFFPVACGVAVFRDKKNKTELDELVWCYQDFYRPFSNDWLTGVNKPLFVSSDQFGIAGDCYLYPCFRLGDKEIIAKDKMFRYTVPGCWMSISSDTLMIPAAGGEQSFNVRSVSDELKANVFQTGRNYDVWQGNILPAKVSADRSRVSFTLPPKDGVLKFYGGLKLSAKLDGAAAKGGPTEAWADKYFVQEASGKVDAVEIPLSVLNDGVWSNWLNLPHIQHHVSWQPNDLNMERNGDNLRITSSYSGDEGMQNAESSLDLRFDLNDKNPHITGGKYTLRVINEWEDYEEYDSQGHPIYNKYSAELNLTAEILEGCGSDGRIRKDMEYPYWDEFQADYSVSADYVYKRNGIVKDQRTFGNDMFRMGSIKLIYW